MPFGPLRSTALLDHSRYRVRLLLLWVYGIAWLVLSVSFAMSWHDAVSTPIKVVVVVVIVLGTPTISDLFQSYARYRDKWQKENVGSP